MNQVVNIFICLVAVAFISNLLCSYNFVLPIFQRQMNTCIETQPRGRNRHAHVQLIQNYLIYLCLEYFLKVFPFSKNVLIS